MLQEPVVPTHVFHAILALLYAEDETVAIEHMESLLQLPHFGPMQWEQRAIQLMREKMIATVALGEAMEALQFMEDAPEWDVIAQRVVNARKKALSASSQ